MYKLLIILFFIVNLYSMERDISFEGVENLICSKEEINEENKLYEKINSNVSMIHHFFFNRNLIKEIPFKQFINEKIFQELLVLLRKIDFKKLFYFKNENRIEEIIKIIKDQLDYLKNILITSEKVKLYPIFIAAINNINDINKRIDIIIHELCEYRYTNTLRFRDQLKIILINIIREISKEDRFNIINEIMPCNFYCEARSKIIKEEIVQELFSLYDDEEKIKVINRLIEEDCRINDNRPLINIYIKVISNYNKEINLDDQKKNIINELKKNEINCNNKNIYSLEGFFKEELSQKIVNNLLLIFIKNECESFDKMFDIIKEVYCNINLSENIKKSLCSFVRKYYVDNILICHCVNKVNCMCISEEDKQGILEQVLDSQLLCNIDNKEALLSILQSNFIEDKYKKFKENLIKNNDKSVNYGVPLILDELNYKWHTAKTYESLIDQLYDRLQSFFFGYNLETSCEKILFYLNEGLLKIDCNKLYENNKKSLFWKILKYIEKMKNNNLSLKNIDYELLLFLCEKLYYLINFKDDAFQVYKLINENGFEKHKLLMFNHLVSFANMNVYNKRDIIKFCEKNYLEHIKEKILEDKKLRLTNFDIEYFKESLAELKEKKIIVEIEDNYYPLKSHKKIMNQVLDNIFITVLKKYLEKKIKNKELNFTEINIGEKVFDSLKKYMQLVSFFGHLNCCYYIDETKDIKFEENPYDLCLDVYHDVHTLKPYELEEAFFASYSNHPLALCKFYREDLSWLEYVYFDNDIKSFFLNTKPIDIICDVINSNFSIKNQIKEMMCFENLEDEEEIISNEIVNKIYSLKFLNKKKDINVFNSNKVNDELLNQKRYNKDIKNKEIFFNKVNEGLIREFEVLEIMQNKFFKDGFIIDQIKENN